jgi:hypothetical protein
VSYWRGKAEKSATKTKIEKFSRQANESSERR